MRFQAPRGTHDVLPADSFRWQHLEREFGAICALYGYQEIRTPAFEDYDLFVRSSGETSELVNKQMYDFLDKGNRHIALKPEGTAPSIRAFIEHGLAQQGTVSRLWYMTQAFRYERPALGRFRQSHQFGLELIGSDSPAADAEIIEMTVGFYRRIGISGVSVLLNSIGREETRARYRDALLTHAEPYLRTQDQESRDRAEKNPLRMLDSKDPGMQAALSDAPLIQDYLEEASRASFDQLQGLLREAGVDFVVAPRIVRGLDYYTDTVFEVQSNDLGANNSLCGGGRYDNLVKELGGPDMSAVGVGIGVERALIVAEAVNATFPAPRLVAYVAAATESARGVVATLARSLRDAGLSAVRDLDGKSLKSQLKQADRLSARFALLIGDDELATSTVGLRDLQSGDQRSIAMNAIIEALR